MQAQRYVISLTIFEEEENEDGEFEIVDGLDSEDVYHADSLSEARELHRTIVSIVDNAARKVGLPERSD